MQGGYYNSYQNGYLATPSAVMGGVGGGMGGGAYSPSGGMSPNIGYHNHHHMANHHGHQRSNSLQLHNQISNLQPLNLSSHIPPPSQQLLQQQQQQQQSPMAPSSQQPTPPQPTPSQHKTPPYQQKHFRGHQHQRSNSNDGGVYQQQQQNLQNIQNQQQQQQQLLQPLNNSQFINGVPLSIINDTPAPQFGNYEELTWEEIYSCQHHFTTVDNDGKGYLSTFQQIMQFITLINNGANPQNYLLSLSTLYPNMVPESSTAVGANATLKHLLLTFSHSKSILNTSLTPNAINARTFTPQQALYIIQVFNNIKDKTGGVPSQKLALFGADQSKLPSTTLPFYEFVQYVSYNLIPFENLSRSLYQQQQQQQMNQHSPPIEPQIFVSDITNEDFDNHITNQIDLFFEKPSVNFNNNNNINNNNQSPLNQQMFNNQNNNYNNNNNNNFNQQMFNNQNNQNNFNNTFNNPPPLQNNQNQYNFNQNNNNNYNNQNNQNNNNYNNNQNGNGNFNPSPPNFQNILLNPLKGSGNNIVFNNNNNQNQPNNQQNTLPPFSDIEIQFSELNIQSKLGEGTFGVVYKGTWRNTPVAIKQIKINEDVTQPVLDEFRKELMILSKLRHPNIVLLMAACTNPPNLCFVTEYLNGGSLYDALHSKKIKMHMGIYKKMAIQIAQGMNYLHLSGIIHRDIKSLNLLLDDNMNVKICDFGLSRLKSKSTAMTKSIGSPCWMSPEVLLGDQNYTEKVDVYAFGIILWELGTGELPYSGLDAVQLALAVSTKGLRPTIPSAWPQPLAQLIQSCWHQEASKRPTFQQIITQLENIV